MLGLSPVRGPARKPGGGLRLYASGDPGDVLAGFEQGDHRRDSIAAFVREAWTTGVALRFYEAAMEQNARGQRKKYCCPEGKKGHHYRTDTLTARRASR